MDFLFSHFPPFLPCCFPGKLVSQKKHAPTTRPFVLWGWTSSGTGGFSRGAQQCCWKCFRNCHSKNNSFTSSTAATKLECHLLWPFLRRSSWFCENKVMRWLALQLRGFYSTVYTAISRSWKCFPVLSMKEKLIHLYYFPSLDAVPYFPLSIFFYCHAHSGRKWALFISLVLFSAEANSTVFT